MLKKKDQNSVKNYTNLLFAKLDKDNSGTITESEFMEGCMSKLNNLKIDSFSFSFLFVNFFFTI